MFPRSYSDLFEYYLNIAQDWYYSLGEMTFWILISIGLLQCFFGYRMFIIYLWLIGVAIGLVLSVLLAAMLDVGEAGSIIILIIGTLGGGSLMVALHKLGIFLLGGVVGVGVVWLFHLQGFEIDNTTPYIIGGIIFGVIAVSLERHIIILTTAITGGFLVVQEVWNKQIKLMVHDRVMETISEKSILENVIDFETVPEEIKQLVLILIAGWLMLTILGAFVQYKTTGRRQ